MMIDLHLHSNNSDGINTPLELVDIALNMNRNITAIALTDHDSIDGLEEFLSCGEEKQIITIPGIELSIRHEPERDIQEVHVIGLNIDYTSQKLIYALKKQSKGRMEQKEKICNRLREEFEFDITFDEVKNIAGNNAIGRPHIVEVLIKNNPQMIMKYTRQQFFEMISMNGEAYVFREFEVNLEEAIEVIVSAGGLPILAHPGIYEVKNREKFILMCINSGIKGLEIEYTYASNRPYYNTEKAGWAQEYFPNYFRKIAEKYDLIKSGGSDYHGGKKGIKIGDANVPDKYLRKFL